jgi:hypothetical protein
MSGLANGRNGRAESVEAPDEDDAEAGVLGRATKILELVDGLPKLARAEAARHAGTRNVTGFTLAEPLATVHEAARRDDVPR